MPESYYFEEGTAYEGERPMTGREPLQGGPNAENVQIAQGLEAVVRDMSAASQEIKKAATELSIQAERNQTMYGQTVGLGTGVGEMQREMTQDIHQAIQEEVRSMTPGAEDPQPTGRQVVSPADFAPVTQQVEAPVSPAMGASSREIYEGARDYFGGRGGFSLANVRQDLGSRLYERMGNWQFGEQLAQDENGLWRAVDEAGGLGEFADEARIAAFMQRERIMGAGREFGRALSQGQTLRQAGLGALPGGAARTLGVAGAGLFAAQQLGDFFENQRAQNAQFQRVLGGTNVGAIGERFRQQMFGLSQFGVMDSGEAERLYAGVVGTGLRGEQRQTALDFATQNYREFGMTIDQSMRIINTAAETGQESLTGLARALRDVTETAREAGVNTEQARQAFVSQWETFSDLVRGPSAVTAAQGVTTTLAGLGREYQGIQFQATDMQALTRQAQASGYTNLNEYLAAAYRDEGVLARGADIIQGRDAQSMLTPQGLQMLQSWIPSAPRGRDGRIAEDAVREMAARLMESGGVINVEAVIRMLQISGYTGVSYDTAIPLLIRIIAGETNFEQGQEEVVESWRTEQIENADIGFPGGPQDISQEQFETAREEIGEVTERVRESIPSGGLFGWFSDADASRLAESYLADVRMTGRTGGISEALTTDATARAGIQRVQVDTDEGPRVVTLDQAMNYYRDQLDAGTATVIEGDKAGLTIAEAVGGRGDESVEVTSMGDEMIPEVGMSQEEFQQDVRSRGAGETQGQVVLGFTEEAKRIFTPVYQSGGVTYEEDWVPGNPHVTPSQRPSGNPRR